MIGLIEVWSKRERDEVKSENSSSAIKWVNIFFLKLKYEAFQTLSTMLFSIIKICNEELK